MRTQWIRVARTMILVASLAGCTRKVCDMPVEGGTTPTPFWSKNLGLIPKGAQACSYKSSSYESLTADFEPEPQAPIARVWEHLESLGWSRASQKKDELTSEAVFNKAGDELVARTLTAKGRTQISYSYTPAKPTKN